MKKLLIAAMSVMILSASIPAAADAAFTSAAASSTEGVYYCTEHEEYDSCPYDGICPYGDESCVKDGRCTHTQDSDSNNNHDRHNRHNDKQSGCRKQTNSLSHHKKGHH